MSLLPFSRDECIFVSSADGVPDAILEHVAIAGGQHQPALHGHDEEAYVAQLALRQRAIQLLVGVRRRGEDLFSCTRSS